MKQNKIFVVMTIFSLLSIGILIMAPASMSADSSIVKEKNWKFNLAPFYIWGVAIEGDVTTGTNTVPVEVSFDDITDNLEAAFIVHFEGMHKSNWGFLIDVNYLDISGDTTLPGPLATSINVDFDTTLMEFSGLYRMVHGEHWFDAIVGFRYVRMENKVTTNGGPTLVDDDQDWLDPIVGLRWNWGFADKWSLVARGDIGGFGLGSDLALQGLAAVDWQPFRYVSFIGGYRAIYQDFEDGSGADLFRFDATMHGPLLGLNFRW